MTSPTPSSIKSASWWYQFHLKDVAVATIIVLAVGLGFMLLLTLLNVLVGLFIALLVATAVRPLMNRLQSWSVPVKLSAALSAGFLVCIVAGFLFLIVPLLMMQFQSLVYVVPQLYSDARKSLTSSVFLVVRQLAVALPVQLAPTSTIDGSMLITQTLSWLPSVGHALFVAISTIVFTYYWLLYRDRSIRSLLLLLPEQRRAGAEQTWLQVEDRIGAFIRGQLLLSLATGALSLIGYWAIGLPYPLLLALLAGILEFIPYIGPFVSMLLGAVSGLSVSPSLGLSGLAVGIIVQQIENVLLVPRIMEKTVGISPVISLLAFIGFTALFGPIGGLLAIPLAALLQLLFRGWVERRSNSMPTAQSGRGTVDRLRYQIADLSDDLAIALRQREPEREHNSDEAEEQLGMILVDLRSLVDRAEQPQ